MSRLRQVTRQIFEYFDSFSITYFRTSDRYSIHRRDLIHRSQKVQNLLNEKLTPLQTKPPRLDLAYTFVMVEKGDVSSFTVK